MPDDPPAEDLQRWRLTLAYDGSAFRGFAAQPGQPTVAGALSTALARVARAGEVALVCAGRTDAGVHARGQVVHVDLPASLPVVRRRGGPGEMGPDDLRHALNRQLAPAVVVRTAERVGTDFDARRSARSRHYRYLVWNAPVPEPLLARVAWHVAEPLDLRALHLATDPVLGEHDFRAFCRRAPGRTADEPIVRRVTGAAWSIAGALGPDLEAMVADRGSADGWVADGPEGRLLRFDITAGSFCHQMVRSLVGALVGAGRGRGSAATMMALLASSDRSGAPDPAPAHGLSLESVAY